jgi:hypothetical protein
MDSSEYEASQLADLSTFDEKTLIMTRQFVNADDFLNRVEAELGFDGNDDQSLDRSVDGPPTPRHPSRSWLMPRLLWRPPSMIPTWTCSKFPCKCQVTLHKFFLINRQLYQQVRKYKTIHNFS